MSDMVVEFFFICFAPAFKGNAMWHCILRLLAPAHGPPDGTTTKSQRRSKLPHNFYGQQEQSFLRHPIQESGLWCCRNSMHSEIDHSLPFRQLAPPFIPSTSTSKLVERDFQEGPNPHPLLSPSSP